MLTETEILKEAKYWASSSDFDSETNNEISKLLENNNSTEINNRFYKDLEFGTGGLRGIVGAGTAYMNIFNIRKASFALGQYILEQNIENKTIAISYDSRNHSQLFAKTAAEVFAYLGINVLITKEMRPVPMLSFMVRHFKCVAGVCITASHNPPNYNGYKVYWQTGGQITPPHDNEIINIYKNIHNYNSLPFTEYNNALKNNKIKEIKEELDSSYHSELQTLRKHNKTWNNVKIVYTPLHGSGIYAVPKALESFGFSNIILEPEQKIADGNFPTVSSPNPEDSEALSKGIQCAKENNADLILATDPDCDRLAMVVKTEQGYKKFNGNQLACLLTEYTLDMEAKENRLNTNSHIIKTIVTTDLISKIAAHYNIKSYETLTGFKWIADHIEKNTPRGEDKKSDFVCGGEESYGFLVGSFVRDKDAISSCCIAAEMYAYYKSINLSLDNVLDNIFCRDGLYQESLYTLTLEGKRGSQDIDKVMNTLSKPSPKNS